MLLRNPKLAIMPKFTDVFLQGKQEAMQGFLKGNDS
jgi:hypothetical protein